MAVVTLKFHLRATTGQAAGAAGAVPTAALNMVVLPFELENGFRISHPDDVEVSVLSNRDGYCMLSILGNNPASEVTLHINDAFGLTDERTRGRIRFTCDNSYRNLKQHRTVLDLPSTVSKYDITISLPQEYRKDELSFEPSQDQWTTDEPGKTYTLPASAPGAAGEVWIAFPSPFKGGLEAAQILVSIIIAFALLGIEGKFAIERKLAPWTLRLILVVSLVAIGLTTYFALTLAQSREFLAWAAGPLVPLVLAPFICGWLLVRPNFEAEMRGIITLEGKPPTFVDAWLELEQAPGEWKKEKRVKLKDDGSYDLFVWCGKSVHRGRITASGRLIKEGRSEECELARRIGVGVVPIDLQRIKVQASP